VVQKLLRTVYGVWEEEEEDSRRVQRGNGGLWETVRAAGSWESGCLGGEEI
jgi:hypothetical protein